PEVRQEILDYCLEIEWFDTHLGRMLAMLEAAGELDNTLVIVTADNGMPFPRSKANCYEYGIHMPLAVRWGGAAPGGRVIDDLVGFVDLTATIVEAAGAKPPTDFPMSGRSLMELLKSSKQGVVDPSRDAAWAARERHTSARYNNWSYPQRALRTAQYLYIRNFESDRWPMGDPREIKADGSLGPEDGAYYDMDMGETRTFMLSRRNDPSVARFFQLAVAKRPADELFDIIKDPGCLNNLATNPAFDQTRQDLARRMTQFLEKTGDPRALGKGEIWESYPRYSNIRGFPPPDTLK
ncbi:MAG TPA: sulfatase/phosphatase domain-containing protein, partial [Luteolibacter sp.]|nr:sulfatase/phosphatase domain-containing protein [Luteolibacter sp.]